MKQNLINIDNFLKKFNLNRQYLRKNGIQIETNENTYFPKEELESGWLMNLYSEFSKKKQEHIDSMAIVGIGAGVESLLFIEMFKLNKLYCLDINKGVLDVAYNNVTNNLNEDVNISLVTKYSDLLDYLISNSIKVNIIYENLPNLRLSNNLQIERGLTTASFYSEANKKENIDIPAMYDSCMLRLHYRFLLQAKECLLPGGKVICCIGARIPISIIKNMFNDLGYKFTLLRIGVVEQLSAEEVLATYSDLEDRSKNKFLFFTHNKSKVKAILEQYHSESDIKVFFDSLFGLGISATQALAIVQAGKRVDHLGLIIEGELL